MPPSEPPMYMMVLLQGPANICTLDTPLVATDIATWWSQAMRGGTSSLHAHNISARYMATIIELFIGSNYHKSSLAGTEIDIPCREFPLAYSLPLNSHWYVKSLIAMVATTYGKFYCGSTLNINLQQKQTP